MAKVNKAYSLDIETIKMVEDYTHGGINSRSALVNNAIKWYIRGDIHELLEQNKKLEEQWKKMYHQLHGDKPVQKSWWKRILGLN